MRLPDLLPRVRSRGSRHRTGVDNHNIRSLGAANDLVPGSPELNG